jgi:uncharacterized protein YggE
MAANRQERNCGGFSRSSGVAVSIVLVIALVCGGAEAQEAQNLPVSTITTTGQATVETTPDRAEFWLYFKLTGATLLEAAEKVQSTEVNVLTMLQDREITPYETVVTAPSIPDANNKSVTFALRLQFTVGRLATGTDEPVIKLAEVCDALKRLAEDTGALLTGPVLKVSNKVNVERNAIMRAMENALPHAEAGAQIMSSEIATIYDVRIEEIVWNQETDYAADQPNSERATCTARVQVVYVLE